MHRLIANADGNNYLAQALNRLYALSVRSLYLSHVPISLIQDELRRRWEPYAMPWRRATPMHDPRRRCAGISTSTSSTWCPAAARARSDAKDTGR